jgi:hypothetical protein
MSSVYSVHVNLLLPYVIARASEAFCRFAFGARSGVAQAARWPSVAANFKTDLLIKWKNRTKHHVCIKDLLKDPSEFSTKKKQKMRDDWLPGGVGRNRTHDRIHASHALERFQSVSGTWCDTERQKEFAISTQSHGGTHI